MKGKILIVDDLADFRKLLRDALEDTHTVTEADSKAALEKAFTQGQPDLVLLDNMPPALLALALREPDRDAVVRPDRLGLDPEAIPEPALDRQGPRRVHPAAERAEDDEAPVAELVAEALDDNPPVGREGTRDLALLVAAFAAAFGLIMSVFGGGSLLGILLGGVLPKPSSKRLATVLLSVMSMMGIGVAVTGVAPSTLVAALASLVMGIANGYNNILLITWLQNRISPAMTGRIMSLIRSILTALEVSGFSTDRGTLGKAAGEIPVVAAWPVFAAYVGSPDFDAPKWGQNDGARGDLICLR